ncbi:response regulator [Nordella sp. HKS 07]|uniref:response regulator transcription factor n=1 Tax=Nordella sp. HKS 07 TaxID=2712222 RepID=UPI0013E10965|nr:response regulator [Nordella sp. HKS 07]QIG47826.1 response regulator [Nordella sp. HKS 07]
MMVKIKDRIAIVDDDAAVRQALRRLLNAAALEAVSYSSGAEFLEALASGEPSCVILDMHMPGLSGLDVQRHLAKSKSTVPVIVITGHDSPLAREEAMALGARAYLAKPVEGRLLIAQLRKLARPAKVRN